MTNALSLPTFRTWFKPKDTASKLVQHFDLNTTVILFVVLACLSIVVAKIQADSPLYLSLISYLLAPTVFILLTKWATRLSWITLLKIALLGLTVTIPLHLLSSISIGFIATYKSGESNLILFSFLALLYFLLPIWSFTIQLRLYSKMLDVRKRTVFAISIAAVTITISIILLLFQLTPQV